VNLKARGALASNQNGVKNKQMTHFSATNTSKATGFGWGGFYLP
jgi:hypothetical protein